MLIGALVCSALLLLVVNLVAIGGAGRGCVAAGLALPLGLFIGHPLLLVNAFFVLIAGLTCLQAETRARQFLKRSFIATLGTYLVFSVPAVMEVMDWARLRELYPLESLEARLAYENDKPAGNSRMPIARGASTGRTAEIPKEVFDRVTRMEEDLEAASHKWDSSLGIEGWRRVRSLERLHAGYVTQFINSRGFGAMRMVRQPKPDYVVLPEVQPIPLAPSPSQEFSAALENKNPGLSSSGAEKASTLLAEDSLWTMHREGYLDFLDPKRFGYVKDHRSAAGFQPHEFSRLPYLPEETWRIERLELVSLLKHDEPVAYLSQRLPRMQDLQETKIRSLDAFEKEALLALQQGADLKVDQASSRIQMVGSVRAAQQCLKCHNAERGDLLGAFSYTLRKK
jgi:hypothetical protein